MFTETELANLRTACMTSRMRTDVESCTTLDTLAMKLFKARGDAMVLGSPRDRVAGLVGALQACQHQIEQMRGMFDDADGAIQTALDDADEAIAAARGLYGPVT